MGLSKNITLTIKDYEIKLDKEIKFYENDTIDLCFSILEYGIEVKDGISINKLMPIQALRSYMLIETPHGIDYAESTKIEDNKIVFNLGTKYSQFVGIGRMQIVVKDSDGCRVTLPEFEFEIKESINMNWDRESFDFLATEDDSIIIDEFGRKIHMSKISDMPESENISEESYAMIIDEEGNKRFKVRAIVDAVEHSLDDKFNAYTDEINGDVEEFKGSVRTNITTLTNENNTFKNQVNTSLANYGSDYNGFKDNVEARLGEHMTDYNRFKDGVESRIEEGESTYDGFVSDVSTVLDNYGSTYNDFKSEVNTANASFRNTLNASNQAFRNEMVDRYNNFVYKIDEDIFEGGRTDYFGETHEKIGERLDLDFDVVHQRINDSGLMEYEGCSITANNTYYGRQKETVIKGRTLQNLVKTNVPRDIRVEKSNMIGCTSRELSIFNESIIKAGSNYTIIFNVNELTCDFRIAIREHTNHPDRQYITLAKAGDSGLIRTSITIGNFIINEIFLFMEHEDFQNGEVASISDVILLEGDHTQTPLEELPFIEGIESSGDKSKNLFNVEWEQGAFTLDGEILESANDVRCSDFIQVKPNTRYTLSNNGIERLTHVYEYDVNKNFIIKNATTCFMTTSDTMYIKMYGSTNDREQFQIEEGMAITPYEPYYDGYKISGKSHGKNLFNKKNMEISDLYVPQGENNIVKAQTLRGFIMKIIPNTDYVLSKSYRVEDCFRVYGSIDYPMANGNAKNLAYGDGSNQVAFNTEQFKYIFCVCYTNKESGEIDEAEIRKIFDTIQLEESTKLTSYEPYKESNYSYILNEPLRSLPNGVCDEIDLTTGVLTRRVGKVVFDGNIKGELFTVEASINGTVRYLRVVNIIELQNLKQVIDYNNHICDKLPVLNPYLNNTNCISVIYRKDVPEFDSEFRLCLTGTEINTQDYINWLNENPLTIYFELEVPTTEQLTPQQLKSFDTTTHIISDNKLMPVVSTKIPTDLGAMVNTLSLRNRELEEVNEQQDELIDITMMATDEMYSMLEPLMEAVEPMGLLDCSKMAQMYVAMVRRGIKKIEDVPSRYQEEVKEVLGIKIEEEEWGEDDGIK